MVHEADVVVIGAGIVGLATARSLLRSRPGLSVVVVDKEGTIGAHQTGHNSGVIHSGIYYRPGSLKATLCTRGKVLMETFADEHGVPFDRVGKLIVALDERELPRLEELHRRAIENGVGDVRMVDAGELREIEPNAVGLRALHAPSTGVIDYGRVARAIAADVEAHGGTVHLGRAVTAIRASSRALELACGDLTVRARHGIACAGLQSDRLARLAGIAPATRIVPFRGDYYTLAPESSSLVRGLVYPVPDPAFPFLGVHFTRRIDGSVIAGPNAVLALAREGYRRLALRPRDAIEGLTFPGVWRFVRSYPRTAAAEVWRDVSKRAFVADMQRYVPAVRGDAVTFGPSGIRAQAMLRDGTLLDDFVIEGSPRMMHVLNAPSPAATASLAIGEELASRALSDLLDAGAPG